MFSTSCYPFDHVEARFADRGTPRALLLFIALASCGRERSLLLGLDFPDAKSVIVGIDLDDQLQVFAVDPGGGEVTIRRESSEAVTGRAHAFRYDEPLDALGLSPGALEPAGDSSLGSSFGALPPPRWASTAELGDAGWSEIAPPDSPLIDFRAKELLPDDSCPTFELEAFFRLGTTSQPNDALYLGDGVIWVAAGGDRATAVFAEVSRTSSSALDLPTSEGVVEAMAKSPSGEIWLATSSPAVLWRGARGRAFERVTDLPGDCTAHRLLANDREVYGIGKCGLLHRYDLSAGQLTQKRLSPGGGPAHVRGSLVETAGGQVLIADPSGNGTVHVGQRLDFSSELIDGPPQSVLTAMAATPLGIVAVADLESEAQFKVRGANGWEPLGPQLSISAPRSIASLRGGFAITGVFGYLRLHNGFRFCESQPGILSSSSGLIVVRMTSDTVFVAGNRFGSSDFPNQLVVAIARSI